MLLALFLACPDPSSTDTSPAEVVDADGDGFTTADHDCDDDNADRKSVV